MKNWILKNGTEKLCVAIFECCITKIITSMWYHWIHPYGNM